jgi:prostaglandin-E synthase
LWAQRTDKLFLTVNVSDGHDDNISIDEEKLQFESTSGDGRVFQFSLVFYNEINPAESKWMKTGQNYTFVIQKKEDAPYWPRLLKEAGKKHWLKTDFGKWKDEDDEDEDDKIDFQNADGFNPFNMDFQQMTGMPEAGDSDDEQPPAEEDEEEEKQ